MDNNFCGEEIYIKEEVVEESETSASSEDNTSDNIGRVVVSRKLRQKKTQSCVKEEQEGISYKLEIPSTYGYTMRLRRKIGTKQKKRISIAKKVKILKDFEEGKSLTEVADMHNLARSTLTYIRKNKSKIEQCAEHLSNQTAKTSIRVRNLDIHKLETLLFSWIGNQRKKGIDVSGIMIRQKASSLFNSLKSQNKSNSEFAASRGWFQRFCERHQVRRVSDLHNFPESELKVIPQNDPLEFAQESLHCSNSDTVGQELKRSRILNMAEGLKQAVEDYEDSDDYKNTVHIFLDELISKYKSKSHDEMNISHE